MAGFSGESFIGFDFPPSPSPDPEPIASTSTSAIAGPSYSTSLAPEAAISIDGELTLSKGKKRARLDQLGRTSGGGTPAREKGFNELPFDGENTDQPFVSKKQERQQAERRTPWAEGMDWEGCRNPAELLNKEIISFVNYISPTPTEHACRSHIISLIRNAIKRQWPDATVSPFGSFETGLYLPTGDIDLVVTSDSMNADNKVKVLHTLASVLRTANLAQNIQVIAKAKVPIVKFISSYGRLPIDISLNQVNGISAGRIVNTFIHQLPALKPLVLVIKAFLNQRNMNEVFSGGLGSYSVICLVISFLQVHPKIRRAEINPLQNLGVLLIEFFELYGRNFGYDVTGITLRAGGGYFDKSDRGWMNEKQPFLLCIEDPQDTSNDIARGSYGIARVRSTFAGAYEVLTSRLYLKAAEISARKHGGPSRRDEALLRGEGYKANNGFGVDDEGMSVLVGIMGVTQEVLNHRRIILELYNAGTLQRILGIPLETFEVPPPPILASNNRAPLTATKRQAKNDRKLTMAEKKGDNAQASRDVPPPLPASKSQGKLSAIHVSDSPPPEGGKRRYSLSSSSSVEWEDKPFKAVFNKGVSSKAPLQPVASSSKALRPASAARHIMSISSEDEEDSRYSSPGRSSRPQKRARQESFAPSSRKEAREMEEFAREVISLSETDSDDEGSIIAVDQAGNELDALSKEGKADEVVDSDEENNSKHAKAGRRKARKAKRDYWRSKGGDGSMQMDLGSF